MLARIAEGQYAPKAVQRIHIHILLLGDMTLLYM